MLFGIDGLLYVTVGDGGEYTYAQDMSTTHGSLLRLTADGKTPADNPFTRANGYEAYHCADSGGKVPVGVDATVAVCSETYAIGLRNPFRMSKNSNIKDKDVWAISDVGAKTWEELSYAGTDYVGANYGYGTYEGVCLRHSDTVCPQPDENLVGPFHWYSHRKNRDGCVSGSVFVPDDAGWPAEYKFLFADFIFFEVYNLIEDLGNECRSCSPPTSRFRNETFHQFFLRPDDNVNEARVADLFFGPYKDSQALYIVKNGNTESVIRVRYKGFLNRPPLVDFAVEKRPYQVGEEVHFDGSLTVDPDDDELVFSWFFGDGSTSSEISPTHVYNGPGEYRVVLAVVDTLNQKQERTKVVVVGVAPSANIVSPLEGVKFSVGQVLRLKGEATYTNGTLFKDSQLEWEVVKHHDAHFHPFLDPIKGNNFDLSPAPQPEDFYASRNSHLEVILRVTGEYGLTTEVSRLIYPKLVVVTIDTEPSGLEILVQHEPFKSPIDIWSWWNHSLHLKAEDHLPFVFKAWSDSSTGNRERAVSLVRNDLKIVAHYCVAGGGSCHLGGCCKGACLASGVCSEDSVFPPVTWAANNYTESFDKTPAESFGDGVCHRGDGVDAQRTTDSICIVRDQSVCNVAWWDPDEYLVYPFSIPQGGAGTYNVRIRAAAKSRGKKIGVDVIAGDGSLYASFSSLVVANGFQNFRDVFFPVDLKEDQYELVVYSTSGMVNMCSVAVLQPEELGDDGNYMTVPGFYNAMMYRTDSYHDTTAGRFGDCPVRVDTNVDGKRNTDVICNQAINSFDVYCNIGWTEPGEFVVYRFKKSRGQNLVSISLRLASMLSRAIRVEISDDSGVISKSKDVTFPGSRAWTKYETFVVWDQVDIGNGAIYNLKVTFLQGQTNMCSVGIL